MRARPASRRSKRRRTLFALFTVAAAAIWLLWPDPARHAARRATVDEPSSSTASDELARRASPAPTVPRPAPHGKPTPWSVELADAPVPVLPPDTQRLYAEFVPGTTEPTVVPVHESMPLKIIVNPVRFNVVAPDPIVVTVEVRDDKNRTQPLDLYVKARSMGHEMPWIALPVADDGSGADARAGDGIYTATYTPPPNVAKQLYGRVVVEAGINWPGVGVRRVPATLIYTRGPSARLTGAWSDRVEGGHLVLEAGLDVDAPGHYNLMAQLYGPGLEPIAWVRESADLPTGRATMRLRVWGKAITDAGIDGPYRVRNVLVTRDHDDDGDYDPSRTVVEAYQTAPYHVNDFSPEPWQPPRIESAPLAVGPAQLNAEAMARPEPQPLSQLSAEALENPPQPMMVEYPGAHAADSR